MSKESEWQTRKLRIDTRLKELSSPWKIQKYDPALNINDLHAVAIEEYPTENGPVDYAFIVNGKILGILEAKKVSVNPQNVLEQAKRYSRGLTDGPSKWQNEYYVPFLYSSNGEVIWHIDVRASNSYSRTISEFHTPEALDEFYNRENDFDWFLRTPLTNEKLYPFQAKAVVNIEKAIIKRKREMLLAMATGTGKTFTTVSLIYRLLESKQFRRILFLVDRRALAAQAVTTFNAFETSKGNKLSQEYEVYSQKFRKEDFGEETASFNINQLPEEYITKPQSSHTFVYVSTIQRMAINILGAQYAFRQSGGDVETEEDAGKLNIPIHAFDVIVADECHRGYTFKETATWRKVFDHFDAIKIGLTATPASHTLSLFKHIVFRYTTEEAVRDGFLVDYDAVKINSKVKINGAFLNKGEEVGVVDTETGDIIYDELEDEREFDASEIEVKITSPDSNRKIIEQVAKYAYEHETETGRFPKILIFAVNDIPQISHADQIVRICRDVFGQGDEFVQKITGSITVDRPLKRIREFRNRPDPKVVVTVDMLSTGVDIPALEFIVFMRFVKSRILWVQMLGRGTRRCDEINKTHFTVFDCFDGTLIEYFKNVTDFTVEIQQETIPIEQVIENIYQNIDRDYNIKSLVRRMQRIAKDMSGEAREDFASYLPDGDIEAFAKELHNKLKHNFINTMKLLRNKDFIDLLKNYKRSKRNFLIGYGIEDEVSSEVMFRVGDRQLRPADYLKAFSDFVTQNKDKIEAFQVLINRPDNWRTEVLDELKVILQKNHFKQNDLAKAHLLVYHLSLVDIISMIKHAVNEQAELLSPGQRVDRAIAKIIKNLDLNEEQKQWLGYIREHLVENLTIDENDFTRMPVFERHGGLGKAKKVFGDDLPELLHNINRAIAA